MASASLKDLRDNMAAGKPFDAAGKEIDAETIRRLILNLPLKTWGRPRPLTASGLVIRKAVIDERVELDRVMPQDGAWAPPIEFHQCHLKQGFSGAHGKFSRLSFRNCTFGDPRPREDEKRPVPTVDLTDAHVDSDLDMAGVKPEEEDGHLWIRAVGAQINGKVELSGCQLRAPVEKEVYPAGEEPVAALNLTLSTVRGDIRILRAARLEGGIRLRGAHVEGDVWMRGATVTAAKDGDALFLQRARIGGFLVMDGGWDKSEQEGEFHGFRCEGNLNLRATDVGRSLYLDAVVVGEIEGRDLCIGDDFFFGGAIRGEVNLTGCRIGGSLEMPGLNLAPSVTRFTLRHGIIGRSLKLVPGRLCYSLLSARRTELRSLPGVELIEGLWRHKAERDSEAGEEAAPGYHLAQSAFLKRGGKIWALDGRAGVFRRVVSHAGHRIDETSVGEYLRLYCAWCYQEEGLSRIEEVIAVREERSQEGRAWTVTATVDESGERRKRTFTVTATRTAVTVKRIVPECPPCCKDAQAADPKAATADADVAAPQVEAKAADAAAPKRLPRFASGLLLLPNLPRAARDDCINAGQWFVDETLPHMEEIWAGKRLTGFHKQLCPHLRHRILLAGAVDLENLTCGVLDDHAGRAWGGDVELIAMDHFAYRRATWTTGRDRLTMPTYRRFSDWLARNVADWLWPRWMHWPEAWKRQPLHWEPWQCRRNWIYHQFPPAFDEPYVSRYPIDESDYRPQPFDQAARVARAEGRENFAIQFEMLKQRIEWRLFNLRSRWWLGVTGFALAYLWILAKGADPGWTAFFFVLTIVGMLFLSPIHKGFLSFLKRQWLTDVVLFVLFIVPAAVLFLVDGWGGRPLNFLIAVLIFVLIRSLSWLAGFTLRVGFGYLRRPLRALVTLTAAFLLGWWGVAVARSHQMLVVDAEPVAGLAGPAAPSGQPEPPPRLMGSESAAGGQRFIRDIPCDDTLVAPLYALDVLVPLVDLREESRCEIRRLPKGWEEAIAAHPNNPTRADEAVHALEAPGADDIGSLVELWENLPELTVKNHHFWAVLKVFYAIAGWFIVSLALLTFTQVNRTREDALPEVGRG